MVLMQLLQRIDDLDKRLTPLEVRFSATLGQATRSTLTLLNIAMAVVALVLTALGHADRAWRRPAQVRASRRSCGPARNAFARCGRPPATRC